MILAIFTLGAIAVGSLVVEPVYAHPKPATSTVSLHHAGTRAADSVPPNCFPAIGFKMPTATPASLTNWWCNHDTEYAFVGFSYEVTACEKIYGINVFCVAHYDPISCFRPEFVHIERGFFRY